MNVYFDQIMNCDLVNDMRGFRRKLSNLYNWSDEYIDRCIIEYKKFLYLGKYNPVVPSWEIDQIWHLHLQYTKEYWEVWCDIILQKKFHHIPDTLGKKPNPKFSYTSTIKLYKQTFNQEPPSDIWTEPCKRDIFLVDLEKNWVIPKGNIFNLIKLFFNYGIFSSIWNSNIITHNRTR